MKNNAKQVTADGLPIVSENEQVQKNSMRLYVYLVSISQFQGKNKPRTFSQRDFTINKIHTLLDMHEKTIKKYWRILEENGLIKYEGPKNEAIEQGEWDKAFMLRKKNTGSYYTVPKEPHGYIYRIMPRETITKIQEKFMVSELELKLYFLLANMQERFCYYSPPERIFTIADLRDLLKLSKKTENIKAIVNGLMWLEKLNLIEYRISYDKTNLRMNKYVFELVAVNYYTDGGEMLQYLKQDDKGVMPPELKEKLLNENIIIEFVD